MKQKKSLLLAALSLAGLFTAAPLCRAASFTEAQFTRLENEVKILKENSAPRAAAVGDNVNAVSSVSTGANSRAELRFPDKSLTRLGANSRFTIRGEERTLDLDKGVMMISVPKKMGGAKVRTAAVTAAVTGTTVIYEYLPNGYLKIMVIEGTLTAFSNKNHSSFQDVHAGQMIIMDPNSTIIPPPVDFDLKRLLKTSPLLKGYQDMPNFAYINGALQNQQNEIKDGTLLNTNLVIPGLGTLVSITDNTAHNLTTNVSLKNAPPGTPNNPNNPPPNNNQPPPGFNGPIPPAFQGFLPLISGTTVLNNTSTIVPDPTITGFNTTTGGVLTSEGLIYHGQAVDGPFAFFVFGTGAHNGPNFQGFVNASGDAGTGVFKFDSLFINGTPKFDVRDTEGDHVTDVILAANGDITFATTNPFGPLAGGPDSGDKHVVFSSSDTISGDDGASLNLSASLLTSLAFYSQHGSITIAPGFSIQGVSQDLALNAQGVSSDVVVQGSITLQTGILVIGAGRDLRVTGSVFAADISANTRRDLIVDGGNVHARDGNVSLSAVHNILIADSAQLIQLADTPGGGLLRVQSQRGSVTLTGNVQVNGNSVEIQAFSGNVTLLSTNVNAANILTVRAQGQGSTLSTGGSTFTADRLIQLYAEGNNSAVVFTDDTTLAKVNGGDHSPAVKIAAMTVEIAAGKVVRITQAGPVKIFTDNALFNIPGYGKFVRVIPGVGPRPIKPANILSYASRPAFHGGKGFGPRPKPGGPAGPFTPPRPGE